MITFWLIYTSVNIDFWEKTTYYHPCWQIGINHKASLPMRFIGRQTRKSNKSIILVGFSSLPHGLELLEGNIHAPPNGELAMSEPKGMPIIPIFPLDPMPPWYIDKTPSIGESLHS